ncbi:cupin domain-containing protein [Streptomyces tendae]
MGPESEEDLYLCVGHIAFDDQNAALLTDLLPPLVIVRVGDPHGMRLAQLIDHLATEVGIAAAGGPLVQNHLAQILLVHMLRAHAGQTDRPTGWLGALNEDGIGAALRAVHADVGLGAIPMSLRVATTVRTQTLLSFGVNLPHGAARGVRGCQPPGVRGTSARYELANRRVTLRLDKQLLHVVHAEREMDTQPSCAFSHRRTSGVTGSVMSANSSCRLRNLAT